MSTNKWYNLIDVSELSIDMLVNTIMYRDEDKAIANHCCFNIINNYLNGYVTHDPLGKYNTIIVEYTKTTDAPVNN